MNHPEAIIHEKENLLGLTEYGRRQPDVVSKLHSLVSDCSMYEMVCNRLINKRGFTPKRAEQAEIEFLRFALLLKISDGPLSPPDLADEFWHETIVHTEPYAQWCQRQFGRFIHHRPETADGSERSQRVHTKSRRLLGLYFGKETQVADCTSCTNCSCGSSCTVH